SKFGVSMPRYHARCHAACWGTVWSVPDSDRQGEMRSEVGWGRCPAGSPGIPGLNAPGSLAFALYTSTSDPVPTSDGDEHGAPRGTWHMAHGTLPLSLPLEPAHQEPPSTLVSKAGHAVCGEHSRRAVVPSAETYLAVFGQIARPCGRIS